MSHWYAIQVTSGKEESTCRLMRRLVPSAVLEEVFTPRYETQKKYQGEWRMCQSILFPGYVVAVTPDVGPMSIWRKMGSRATKPSTCSPLVANHSWLKMSHTRGKSGMQLVLTDM